MPFTIVGNLGGALKSNVHLTYKGRLHGDVLATIGTAMGFPDVTRCGEARFNQGLLTDWLA